MGISKVLLVNFSGDFSDKFKDLLELSNYSYRQLELGNYDLFRENNDSENIKG